MYLSADQINLRAPYKVTAAGENAFFFTTEEGIRYSVGFSEDYSFMEEHAYQFYIIPLDDPSEKKDRKIYETVSILVEEFFAQEPSVMLYICDTKDMRQATRDRLFRIWFHTYELNFNYTMYNEQLKIDDTVYYASVILRKDHPMHNEIIASFHNFVVGLPDKLNELQQSS